MPSRSGLSHPSLSIVEYQAPIRAKTSSANYMFSKALCCPGCELPDWILTPGGLPGWERRLVQSPEANSHVDVQERLPLVGRTQESRRYPSRSMMPQSQYSAPC